MLRLAIVFPIHNGLDYTKTCLHALFLEARIEQLNAQVDVVIVDDGSTDGSAEWIKENYPQVHLLNGDGNLWWSGGINRCIEYALDTLHADYTLWWNNDILPGEGYFSNLIDILRLNNPRTIIGSKIYMAHNKDTIWSMGGIFNPSTGFKEMIGACKKDGEEFQKKKYADWLTGMGTIAPASVYEDLGLVDNHRFPQYHGDSDFTLRARLSGYQLVVYPELKIYNDSLNTGLKHNESLTKLIRSLFSIRSNYNISKDLKFYRKHATSFRAYNVLLRKYGRYIGGFFKWKTLGLFGISRR